jgi:hypothetical protein
VEVGDLDGDGLDELAILEQSLLGSQSLSVWRWHGWGLNQDWRSVSGAYQSLVLVSKASCGAQGGGSLILTTQAK